MFETLLLKLAPVMNYIKIGLIVAVFLSGCFVTRLYYMNELKDVEIAVQRAEARAKKAEAELLAKANDIQLKFIKQTETITKRGDDRIIKVVEYVPLDKVNVGFVEFYNAGIENRELKPLTIDEILKPSDITERQVAVRSNENNTACNKYIEQLKALQEVAREIEKTYK